MEEPVFELANRWKRFWGHVIDISLAASILVLILFLSGSLKEVMAQQRNGLNAQVTFWTGVGMCIYLVLNVYFWGTRGQSIGKMVMGTRIVDKDGNIPSLATTVAVRYLAVQIFFPIPFAGNLIFLADSLFIVRKDHRCLHDHLAGTYVIDIKLAAITEKVRRARWVAENNGWNPEIAVDIVSKDFSRQGIEIKYQISAEDFRRYCSQLLDMEILSKSEHETLTSLDCD